MFLALHAKTEGVVAQGNFAITKKPRAFDKRGVRNVKAGIGSQLGRMFHTLM